jgi:hypothetical protein
MAIRLNINAESPFVQFSQRMRPREAALAMEACSTILLQLKETLTRLEDKLVNLSKFYKDFDVRIAVCEVWEVINLSYKLTDFFPLLQWTLSEKSQTHFSTIDALHSAYSTLASQIVDYFSLPNITASVMGDFIWSYRENIGDVAEIFLARSGELAPEAEASVHIDFTRFESHSALHKYDGYTGVLTLDFLYMKNVEGEMKQCVLHVDEVIDWFNRLIEKCESGYSKMLDAQLKSNPEIYTGPLNSTPGVVRIARKYN